jgi:hypothetical protein
MLFFIILFIVIGLLTLVFALNAGSTFFTFAGAILLITGILLCFAKPVTETREISNLEYTGFRDQIRYTVVNDGKKYKTDLVTIVIIDDVETPCLISQYYELGTINLKLIQGTTEIHIPVGYQIDRTE